MFYAKSNFTFLTAIIQVDKQNADRTYKQILQKTNQKQEKCMCLFRRSTGCFNQQSLLWSASPACVTTTLQPVDESTQVSSTKVNAVLKSQRRGSKLKVNAAAKRSTLWPRFLCQVVWPSKIEPPTSFQLVWTKRWPKSTLVKLLRNPSSRNPSSRKILFLLPTCGWNSSSR